MGPTTQETGTGGQSNCPLLSVKNLHKKYGLVHAVRGVDFQLQTNSYVTLLGPSGCGKTSILRMIGGFEEITSGHLELGKDSLVGIPAHKRPVNTVFQSYALFPHLNVWDNVAFGLAYKNFDDAAIKKRVADALATMQMSEMAERRPRQLSGGQEQRVALARAIVNEPKLLLLDEPLSALDRRMRKDMQIELKDLQRRLGTTFFHVTHDQEEAFALSDRIIVMNNGRIEQQGSPQEIYQRPATSYVADFIGGANRLSGRITTSDGKVSTIETSLGRFQAPSVSGLTSGSNAVLCWRPEQLFPAADGAIEATVSHHVYRGAEWLIEAKAKDGTILNFMMRDDKLPAIDEQIRLAFISESSWIAADNSKEP